MDKTAVGSKTAPKGEGLPALEVETDDLAFVLLPLVLECERPAADVAPCVHMLED